VPNTDDQQHWVNLLFMSLSAYEVLSSFNALISVLVLAS